MAVANDADIAFRTSDRVAREIESAATSATRMFGVTTLGVVHTALVPRGVKLSGASTA
jgi:hypothetical protein